MIHNRSISAIRYDFRGVYFALALDCSTNQHWQSNRSHNTPAEWFCSVPFEWRAKRAICGLSQQVQRRGTAQCSWHGVPGELYNFNILVLCISRWFIMSSFWFSNPREMEYMSDYCSLIQLKFRDWVASDFGAKMFLNGLIVQWA